jgi:hypothetical protein
VAIEAEVAVAAAISEEGRVEGEEEIEIWGEGRDDRRGLQAQREYT